MNKTKPFLVNELPTHKFSALPRMPETQLVLLLQRRSWVRLGEYIPTYEAVNLAGRFGADPGDYEWEWLPDPEGIRWWRRDATGRESLFGMAVAVHRNDLVELYGLVEVDETSPFWADVIPEEAVNAMPLQAKLVARQQSRPEKDVLYELYKEYFKSRGMLTLQQPGQPACRRGTVREVERFRDAIKALIDRASQTSLPSEVGRKP